jgi:hypothetical protein
MSGSDPSDLLQTARCEDLLYEQISQVSVVGDFERRIIDATKGSGANLLEGARGVGKSMLLRIAELELDRNFAAANYCTVAKLPAKRPSIRR